jgi:uncharacterized membrane protein YcaP (DUF421 family)
MLDSTILEHLFGEGDDLTVWQMATRAVIVFLVALLLVRASGRRSFGQHSPFDACMSVLFGAILSRAVVGASPFVATIMAAAALAVAHRLLAMASVRWRAFERLVNGAEIEVALNGQVDPVAMQKALVTEEELKKEMRKRFGRDDLAGLRRATLERDGSIAVSEDQP